MYRQELSVASRDCARLASSSCELQRGVTKHLSSRCLATGANTFKLCHHVLTGVPRSSDSTSTYFVLTNLPRHFSAFLTDFEVAGHVPSAFSGHETCCASYTFRVIRVVYPVVFPHNEGKVTAMHTWNYLYFASVRSDVDSFWLFWQHTTRSLRCLYLFDSVNHIHNRKELMIQEYLTSWNV